MPLWPWEQRRHDVTGENSLESSIEKRDLPLTDAKHPKICAVPPRYPGEQWAVMQYRPGNWFNSEVTEEIYLPGGTERGWVKVLTLWAKILGGAFSIYWDIITTTPQGVCEMLRLGEALQLSLLLGCWIPLQDFASNQITSLLLSLWLPDGPLLVSSAWQRDESFLLVTEILIFLLTWSWSGLETAAWSLRAGWLKPPLFTFQLPPFGGPAIWSASLSSFPAGGSLYWPVQWIEIRWQDFQCEKSQYCDG